MRAYWVYIAASKHRVYNVDRLVYFEQFADPMTAIMREKELKGWRCEKKIALIESVNHQWDDLFDDITSS